MKSGYDQFFKKAQKNSASSSQKRFHPLHSSESARAQGDLGNMRSQREMGREFQFSKNQKQDSTSTPLAAPPPRRKQQRQKSNPITLILTIFLAAVGVGYLFVHVDEVEGWLAKIEIGFFESSVAQAQGAKESKKENQKETKSKDAESSQASVDTKNVSAESQSPGTEDHFKVLAERKRQLDEREAELARIEAELEEQKKELEKKMAELEATRRNISSVLEDKVKIDEQRVETLVQMYSNMRAPQAAKIFETLDEGLAIEILGRMKKKNAADIMNLIKPEKAQIFSERFAGYRSK